MEKRKSSLVKSNSGYTELSVDGMLSDKRILFIEGTITSNLAMEFTKQFMDLMIKNPSLPIHVIINSSGGEIQAGSLIIDVLTGSKTPVYVYCFERAYSMAATIFVSVGKNRFMLPNAQLMIHQPSISDISGTTLQMKHVSDELFRYQSDLCTIISSNSNLTKEDIEQNIQDDWYFNAEESVLNGLADKVISLDSLVRENVAPY